MKDILVVDDSRTEQVYLRQLLTRHGYQVRSAFDAEQAWRALEDRRPDLILMDVVMPGTNGFALTRTIARHPAYADIPIVICSSKRQETDRVWGLRQGARDYVTKPVDPGVLLGKIGALLAPGGGDGAAR
ncbi:MAG: response regulator [Pseudomonadota bacterium]|uniref:response regulator n=1 Tax=Tepidimonas thermarum TaxID=335431 RepID=UPI00163D8FE7|nr:response regulator [Tepidimonas thermarum]